MDNATAQPQRVVCPQCQGRGCDTCKRIGIAEEIGGRWIFWGRPVSATTIAERSTERFVHTTILTLLFVFGIAGLGLFAWVLLTAQQGTLVWDMLIAARGDIRMFVFALSLVSDLYLAYRMIRESKAAGVLPQTTNLKHTLTNVQDVLRLPKEERMNVMDALTPEANNIIERGWRLALTFHAHDYTPLFLVGELLSTETIGLLRARLGIENAKLVELTRRVLTSLSRQQALVPAMSNTLRLVLLAAYRHAASRRAEKIDVTDLFAAAVQEDDDTRALFDELAVTVPMLENVIAWLIIQEQLRTQHRQFQHRARFKPKGTMNRAMTAVETPYLDRFARDLTALARAGYLKPCIARDQEIESVFRQLESGRNVLLVGNPGVGKTSIIEGIAQRMVTEDVPKVLQDKRLVSVSIAGLVGSSGGGVEERFNRVLYEVQRSGNIVLFFDNIQNLVGVSSAGAVTLDLSEVLLAATTAARIPVLATTNPVDYTRYVERSSGIMSTFAPLSIEEVDTNRAIKIVEAQSGFTEYDHHVFFSYGAIEKLVTLSERYLHDRYLPEKAITVMEETAIAVHKLRGNNAIVSAEDVANIISEKTHIAVSAVTEEEKEKLLHLEERIHRRIIGQDEAVNAVAAALRRARAELRDEKRPIATMLFLGPTGVGKTELAKTVAQVYFGDEQAMIRLDMSEYQEPSSINQLVGAPPGYGGSAAGGQLTEAVRKQPYALILLDELEKAHPEILNVFLQVMDDGRLTDSSGRTVDFTNAIIIATSNAGTQAIQDGMREGRSLESIKQQLMEQDLARYFKPEFLNRFDSMIVFKPLTTTEVVAVTKLLLHQVALRLAEKGIQFDASEAAVRELANRGYDPLFGARPLRRMVQEQVDNALATFLLSGKLSRRDRAVMEPGGVIRVEKAPSLWDR